MKLAYTPEEVERWRDRIHRRTPGLAVTTKQQALNFVNGVGYCFAFKAEESELPCLWHAACGTRNPNLPLHTHHDPYLSFVWEMKDILPSEGKIYYGKLLRRRPTMVSLDFLPCFYVLSGRTGEADEHRRAFLHGRLSAMARDIMDALTDSWPQVTKGLKLATGHIAKGDRGSFDKAITELQTEMYIVKVEEQHDPFTFVWAPLRSVFPRQLRKAGRIQPETARFRILEQYFKNQLVSSVDAIHRLFRWDRQLIYQTLGRLVDKSVITGGVKLQGSDRRYYCLLD
jgi:hypothetical protein